MTVPIRLAPLRLVVKAVGPKVAAAAADGSRGAIPRPQQRQRGGPVARGAQRVEVGGLADAQRVRDLVHRGALGHVRPVRAEPEVSVVVGLGGGHARRVGDPDGLVGVREAVVARHRERHRRLDAAVGVGLVRGGAPGLC